jgi:hypothetical protein
MRAYDPALQRDGRAADPPAGERRPHVLVVVENTPRFVDPRVRTQVRSVLPPGRAPTTRRRGYMSITYREAGVERAAPGAGGPDGSPAAGAAAASRETPAREDVAS